MLLPRALSPLSNKNMKTTAISSTSTAHVASSFNADFPMIVKSSEKNIFAAKVPKTIDFPTSNLLRLSLSTYYNKETMERQLKEANCDVEVHAFFRDDNTPFGKKNDIVLVWLRCIADAEKCWKSVKGINLKGRQPSLWSVSHCLLFTVRDKPHVIFQEVSLDSDLFLRDKNLMFAEFQDFERMIEKYDITKSCPYATVKKSDHKDDQINGASRIDALTNKPIEHNAAANNNGFNPDVTFQNCCLDQSKQEKNHIISNGDVNRHYSTGFFKNNQNIPNPMSGFNGFETPANVQNQLLVLLLLLLLLAPVIPDREAPDPTRGMLHVGFFHHFRFFVCVAIVVRRILGNTAQAVHVLN